MFLIVPFRFFLKQMELFGMTKQPHVVVIFCFFKGLQTRVYQGRPTAMCVGVCQCALFVGCFVTPYVLSFVGCHFI